MTLLLDRYIDHSVAFRTGYMAERAGMANAQFYPNFDKQVEFELGYRQSKLDKLSYVQEILKAHGMSTDIMRDFAEKWEALGREIASNNLHKETFYQLGVVQ